MDMAMRSFIVAGVLAVIMITAGATWWAVSYFSDSSDRGRPDLDRYELREGSVYDEFGEGSRGESQITIRTGESILGSDVFNISSGAPTGRRNFDSGPSFNWSGGTGLSGSGGAPTADMPRTTPAERVEADCRRRGGGSYACRCLVRLARTDLSETEFEFLSLAEEFEPRQERLGRVGMTASDLAEFSGKLIVLDAGASRRCGTGLSR